MQASVTDLRTDIAVLHLRGDLDIDTAGSLRTTMADLLQRPVPRIVVDLAGLRFCDSVGLSTFVVSNQAVAARGGWLRLAGPNEFLRTLMATVGLTRHFPAYLDVDAALAARSVGPADTFPGSTPREYRTE